MSETTVRVNTEALWYRVATFIGTGLGASIFITNAIYWHRVRQNPCNSISDSEVHRQLWTNVVLGIFFLVLAIWAFYRIFFKREYRIRKKKQFKEKLSSTNFGFGSAKVSEVNSM